MWLTVCQCYADLIVMRTDSCQIDCYAKLTVMPNWLLCVLTLMRTDWYVYWLVCVLAGMRTDWCVLIGMRTDCYVYWLLCRLVGTESTNRLSMRRKVKNLGTGQRKWKSAAQWLAYRRAAVKEAVNQKGKLPSQTSELKISKMARRMWSQSHEKEKKFMTDKKKTRRHSHCLRNVLLWLCFGFKCIVWPDVPRFFLECLGT